MRSNFSVALVISTYNWPQALKLVLESVLRQSLLPDEVIIADDGSEISTRHLIDGMRKKFPVPLRHFWQEDDGFQKTLILNKAIRGSKSDYIIQIDGDILLQQHFVSDHLNAAEKGFYIRGSRVMLSQQLSARILERDAFDKITAFSAGIKNRVNAMRVPKLLPFFTTKSRRSDNVTGCNCAFWRSDLIKVNGYNNDIKGWGHEDIELAARFIHSGLLQKKIKMSAVCYHLHHDFASRENRQLNFTIYKSTIKQGLLRCAKGYSANQNHQPKQSQLDNFPTVCSEMTGVEFVEARIYAASKTV